MLHKEGPRMQASMLCVYLVVCLQPIVQLNFVEGTPHPRTYFEVAKSQPLFN